MSKDQSAEVPIIRLATPKDIPVITTLDGFGSSPIRDIHHEIHKYFGSVDPSTHEQTLIFLLEIGGNAIAKAELMLPPSSTSQAIGYIKRVVVHPDHRGKGLARQLLQHLIMVAQTEYHLSALDLHVWEQNESAIRLYELLGFLLQHRELYYRLNL